LPENKSTRSRTRKTEAAAAVAAAVMINITIIMSTPQSSHRMEAKLNTLQYTVFYVFVKRKRDRRRTIQAKEPLLKKIIDVACEKNDFCAHAYYTYD